MSDTGYFEGHALDAGGRELRFVARYEVDDTVEVFWRARLFDAARKPLGDRHGAFVAASTVQGDLQHEIGDRVRRSVVRDFGVVEPVPQAVVSDRSTPRAARRTR